VRPTWDLWAVRLAHAVATRSEDEHVKVGAVALRPDYSVAGVGYNGAPTGVELPWGDREKRRPFVIHAEVNALRYTTKHDMKDGYMACTHIPCPACVIVLASYGLKTVWYELLLSEFYDIHLIHAIAEKANINLQRIQYD